MRECSNCDWCSLIINSEGRSFYLCVDTNSNAYMSEVGICGGCDLELEKDI